MADSTILPGVRARLVAPDGTTTREFYRFFSALSVTASLPGRVDDLTVRVDDLDTRVEALEHGGGAVRTILGLQSVKVVGPLEDGSVQLSLAGDVISAPALSFYGALAEYGKGWQTFSGNFAALDNGDDTSSLDLADLTDSGTGALLALTFDAKGRKTGSRAATITGTAGRVTVAHGDAYAGLPTIDLATVTDDGGGTLQRTAFDAYGRKTGTSAATTTDLTEGANLYFTDARADARITAAKADPDGIASLVSGKLDPGQLPALAITETFVVASQVAMLALTAEEGDVAVRTDLSQSFILTASPASTLANWQELLTPASPVTSVFGRVGSVTAASGDYTFAQIGSKPTTLAGYGITDAEPAITAGTTAQMWRGDKTFANNVDGPFGVGTSTPNYGGFGNTVTIQHTLHGALEVASSRADATSVLIGAFSGNYLTNSAGHQRIADVQIVSDGTTANQRGGAFYFYVKPNAVTAEVPVFQIRQDGLVIPGTDNTQTLGSSSKRWSVVYAGTGTINTSDEREKTCVSPLTADELGAAAELARAIGTYQWLASVADKGADNARHHAGLTVQRAIEIMQSHGLDPMRYGFICYDQWDETPKQWDDIPEERDDDGNVTREASREMAQEYRPAGDRYSFRTDELLLFMARGFAARLDALEARNG